MPVTILFRDYFSVATQNDKIGTSFTGINNNGDIVGNYYQSAGGEGAWYYGYPHGFRTSVSDATYTFLGTTIATGLVSAYDISDAGTIIGTIYNGGFTEDGFVFKGGVLTRYADFRPVSINGDGDILGTKANKPVILLPNGNFVPVTAASSGTEFAYSAINNADQIVGSFRDNAGYHGFILSGGTYTVFNAPGASQQIPFQSNTGGTWLSDINHQ
jgi:hypothetical protein